MEQVSSDTHAAARKLVQAGASSRLAEAVVETVAEATRTNIQILEDLAFLKHAQADNAGKMATEAGMAEIRNRMATKADLAEIRKVMATKANLGEVREVMATKADLEGLENRMTGGLYRALWIQSMSMLALFVGLSGVVLWFMDYMLSKT